MWKILIFVISLSTLALFNSIAQAEQFPRNQAMPVENVVYGTLTSIRDVSRTELERDKNSGWKTFGGALLGGVIGNQFGSGHGRDITTVLGALVGGGIGHYQSNDVRARQIPLQELMIQQEDGQQVMVVQEPAANMPLQSGDKVRVVYFKQGVRVDKAM